MWWNGDVDKKSGIILSACFVTLYRRRSLYGTAIADSTFFERTFGNVALVLFEFLKLFHCRPSNGDHVSGFCTRWKLNDAGIDALIGCTCWKLGWGILFLVPGGEVTSRIKEGINIQFKRGFSDNIRVITDMDLESDKSILVVESVDDLLLMRELLLVASFLEASRGSWDWLLDWVPFGPINFLTADCVLTGVGSSSLPA